MRNDINLYLLLPLPLPLPLPVFAQEPGGAAAMSVEQVLHQQQDAWNHHDLESFMSGYWNSPELTFFSDAKANAGWQSALDHYRRSYQSEGKEMGYLEFSGLKVQLLAPDAALVRGAWQLTLRNGNKPHGLFTLVLRKFSEGWKIIHDHTSAAES
jgi:ketosteroid isomerase-like protein